MTEQRKNKCFRCACLPHCKEACTNCGTCDICDCKECLDKDSK